MISRIIKAEVVFFTEAIDSNENVLVKIVLKLRQVLLLLRFNCLFLFQILVELKGIWQ